nr:ESPR domain-containing protein [Veillonella denticariosi]
MNRIYRVIWSQVRGAYVVVSEIAKSHSRGSKSFVSNSAKASVRVGLAAMVLTCGSGLVSGAGPRWIEGGVSTDSSKNPTYKNEVSQTYIDGPGNVAVGQQNIVASQYGSSGAFGNQNYVNGKHSDAFGGKVMMYMER